MLDEQWFNNLNGAAAAPALVRARVRASDPNGTYVGAAMYRASGIWYLSCDLGKRQQADGLANSDARPSSHA